MGEEISKEEVEAIYKENSAYVFQIALFLTRSKTLAEDVLQETFIKVLQKYSTYDSSKSFKPWIYSITVNTTRNMLRKQRWISLFWDIPESEDIHNIEESLDLQVRRKELILYHIEKNKQVTQFEIYGTVDNSILESIAHAYVNIK